MSINQEIATWDGKSADDIGAVYIEHHPKPDFIDSITNFITEASNQQGATWLLKSGWNLEINLRPSV